MTLPLLTDRQQVLFDRLVTLGRWATADELPLRVLEIRGFGSFFRGKPRPQDVDLILRAQRPDQTPQFKRFLKALEQIRRDEACQVAYETPREALLAAYERQDTQRRLGFEDGESERRRFGEWIDGYSWNMLYPDTMHKQMAIKSPEDYTKRLIKRRLANLNVAYILNPDDTTPRPLGLRCGFTVSVWSTDAPDVRSNLEQLLSEEAVSRNVKRELEYFEIQSPLIEAEATLLQAEIDLLLRIPRRRRSVDSCWGWFDDWSKDREELREPKQALVEAQKAASQFDEEEWGLSLSATGEEFSLQEAAVKADRLRKQIKGQYQQVDVLEDLRRVLVHYKSGETQTDLAPREYVVSEMLSRGSLRKRQKVHRFLEEMGLPVPKQLP